MPQLSPKLTENLALLDEMFGSSADFYSKEVELYHCRGALVLFDGMASLESLWELLLDAVSRRTPALDETPAGVPSLIYCCTTPLPAESSPVETLDDLTRRLTAGMAVLLLDGYAQGIAFSVQSLKFRSVEEPAGRGISGLPGGVCGSAAGQPEPAAAAHPNRTAGAGSNAGGL